MAVQRSDLVDVGLTGERIIARRAERDIIAIDAPVRGPAKSWGGVGP